MPASLIEAENLSRQPRRPLLLLAEVVAMRRNALGPGTAAFESRSNCSHFFAFRADLLDLLFAFMAGEPVRRVFLSVEAVRKNMYGASAGRDKKFKSPIVRRSKIRLRRHR